MKYLFKMNSNSQIKLNIDFQALNLLSSILLFRIELAIAYELRRLIKVKANTKTPLERWMATIIGFNLVVTTNIPITIWITIKSRARDMLFVKTCDNFREKKVARARNMAVNMPITR